jgi:NAD+ kinase
VALSKPHQTHTPDYPTAVAPSRIGLVVHPSRSVRQPFDGVRQWADRRGVELVQIPAYFDQQHVAVPGKAADCDLLVSIGGDGTSLAAIRAGVGVGRPVLGVACGSLGVLTTVTPDGVERALDRYSEGDWIPRLLPALEVSLDDDERLFALNDIVIIRAAEGQVRVTARVDGTVFAGLAGDGCIVSTPIGSSAYAMSAGGPLLTPDTEAFVLTPLPTHGGAAPPLVLAAGRELSLETATGHGGARLELDGQVAATEFAVLTITYVPAVATIVGFSDQEPFIEGLRRRQIITDSPRILAERARI